MILELTEIVGVAAFSASGYYIARRNGLDLLGIYIAAFLTALGGGIMRDILIDRSPIALTHALPIYLVLGITTLLLLLHRFHAFNLESKALFVLVDAVGMVSFSLSGALATLKTTSFSLAGVTAMAFTTAIGGGILRDILINQVPYVLQGGFYGMIALGVGASAYGMHAAHLMNTPAILSLFICGVALRMVAWKRHWHLPGGH